MSENLIPSVHFNSLSDLEATYWWHQTRLELAENIIRRNHLTTVKMNVVDYGCGTGGFLHQLNERMSFENYLGVDISYEAIQKALKFGDHFRQIDPFDFSMLSNAEMVFLMDALEHVEDDAEFLKNLVDGMKPGANLLISVPAMPQFYSSWDKALGHHRRYSRVGLRKLINKVQASIIYINYAFVYITPALIARCTFLKASYNVENCEFPPVPKFLNNTLLGLNRLEAILSKFVSYPFGSSLFCLIQK
jgi:SAM-dependent methyltransferase